MQAEEWIECVCGQLGLTPLHQASQQGHVLIIKLLLRYHANPDALTTVSRSLSLFILCLLET